ncbi:MAG TPA: TonB-dependent receptor [Deltaproteobacteria bacterium]|nr:TonB-dependent receptor [Deltaproteobacteria bacterium]
MNKNTLVLATAAAIGSMPMFSVPTLAQEGGLALEEVVVSARRRAEDLQDVGLSVSALTETEINRTFARDMRDLAFMSPNLIFDDTSQGPGGNAALYIRGVGVADVEKNFDPAVGVEVDGLFIGANSGAILRSIDLANVEVLRGPQGTLFGRNTIGGTIRVERTRPTGELGGKVRAGYGNYDNYWYDGVLNFGVTENLAVKLSAARNNLQDGYFRNEALGEDEGAIDYQMFGFNGLWSATDTLEFEYTYTREETDQDTPPLLNMGQPDQLFCSDFGLCGTGPNSPTTGDRYTTNRIISQPSSFSEVSDPTGLLISDPSGITQFPGGGTFDADTHILEARWDISDSLSLNYIYGSFETEETLFSNWTADQPMLFGTTRPADYEQSSHELRLTYDAGGPLKAVAGIYDWDSEYTAYSRSWITFVVPGAVLDIPQETTQTTDSQALFFEVDYAFSDAWTLTVGGRYTEDDKTTVQRYNLQAEAEADWGEFTPKVGVRYRMNDDVMFYGTYSEGYRSGGFNGRVDEFASAVIPYDPEFLENYEVGFKSEFSDGRVRLNGAVFIMDYQDKQEEIGLPSEGPTGQRISVFNAATATMQGLELEAQAIVTEGLTIAANFGYLDSEYDNFTYFDGFQETDNSGLAFRRAPEYTFSLNGTYEWNVGEGEAWIRGAFRMVDELFVEQTNREELSNDVQHYIDLSVNYSVKGTTVSLFGRNLLEEDALAHGLNVSGLWSYAIPVQPRTYGLEVTYNFGQ